MGIFNTEFRHAYPGAVGPASINCLLDRKTSESSMLEQALASRAHTGDVIITVSSGLMQAPPLTYSFVKGIGSDAIFSFTVRPDKRKDELCERNLQG